jgi:glycine/D-amino acid oxidase-like deaminating enzyme
MILPGTAGGALWWAGLQPPDVSAAPLPPRADVAVIGGGYTGLAAARALARRGVQVLVLDRETIGWGASSRNGGMVLPGYKADLADLVRRLGRAGARVLFEDSLAAIGFVESLVRQEAIACDWGRTGHLTLAARPAHLRGLEDTAGLLARDFGYQTELIGPKALAEEIGSARYHGGLLDPLAGSLQPARYLVGLAAAAMKAGAVLLERVDVRRIERASGGVRLHTSHGPLDARDVLIATNGYTGRLLPWLARRVVPVGSYVIATERLAPEVQQRLIPRGRMLSDTRNLLYYFRLSPDGRLVFGGRAAFVPTALERSQALLRRGMIEVYPELATARIEYAWGGTLGFTLDQLPHVGRRDGVTYALGYGGHGLALASWLGDRVGQAMAGSAPWPMLTEIPFRSVPFYWGRPWFLPLAGAYYGLKDRLS